MKDKTNINEFGNPSPVKKEKSISVVQEALKNIDSPEIKELLKKRIEFGVKKYGIELHTHTGRNMKQDLLEELIDAINYTQGVMLEEGENCVLKGMLSDLEKMASYIHGIMIK